MRGEHGLRPDFALMDERFIPACAGNTTVIFEDSVETYGSSPHARGTLLT